jgi:putative SOS response-associated peptidase YedK
MDGEIFPTNIVPVQTGPREFVPMKWGFTDFRGNPLINARSETALEKKTFRDSMQKRRCLIPASGYYEWRKTDGGKVKHRFFLPGKTLHLAACWREEEGRPVFVILTRNAAGGAERIHERMPVIIPDSRIDAWLCDTPDVMSEAMTELVIEAA